MFDNLSLSSFHQPERFVNLGIEPPKGVLLFGPPGTGKTLCARAVANRTDACFIRVIGSELVQKYVGEVSSPVKRNAGVESSQVGVSHHYCLLINIFAHREQGWCESCLRWPGPRKPVWSSLMKLMLLEVRSFLGIQGSQELALIFDFDSARLKWGDSCSPPKYLNQVAAFIFMH